LAASLRRRSPLPWLLARRSRSRAWPTWSAAAASTRVWPRPGGPALRGLTIQRIRAGPPRPRSGCETRCPSPRDVPRSPVEGRGPGPRRSPRRRAGAAGAGRKPGRAALRRVAVRGDALLSTSGRGRSTSASPRPPGRAASPGRAAPRERWTPSRARDRPGTGSWPGARGAGPSRPGALHPGELPDDHPSASRRSRLRSSSGFATMSAPVGATNR